MCRTKFLHDGRLLVVVDLGALVRYERGPGAAVLVIGEPTGLAVLLPAPPGRTGHGMATCKNLIVERMPRPPQSSIPSKGFWSDRLH